MSEQGVTNCACCGIPFDQSDIVPWREFCSDACRVSGRAFCKFCNNPLIQSAGKKRKFCSDICRSRYYKVGHEISPSMLEEQNRSTCKGCGNPILPRKNNRGPTRQFCSRYCTHKYHYTGNTGKSLSAKWGSYAPETRKALYGVEEFMGIGAAKRLAAAIDREYVIRRRDAPRSAYITCQCKGCNKEFRRRPWGHSSKEYCSYKCQPISRARSKDRRHAMLTWEEVDEIRNLYATKRISQRELGAKYHVHQGTIWMIVNYKNWKPENDPRRKQDA